MNERQKAHPIIITLLKIQRKYNKDYSWPSQEKIIELMDLRQGIKKSRATLNRWLRIVEDGKYLMRRRRIRRDRVNGMMFKSSLYKITIKGYRLLVVFGIDMSKEISAYQKWLEEINPARRGKKKEWIVAMSRKNPKHQENIQKILAGLGENLAA